MALGLLLDIVTASSYHVVLHGPAPAAQRFLRPACRYDTSGIVLDGQDGRGGGGAQQVRTTIETLEHGA